MKLRNIVKLLVYIIALITAQQTHAQNPENWTSKQLMEPAELAVLLDSAKDLPLIISVGPGAIIPHSADIGMVKEKENLEKLKSELSGRSPQTPVIIYCGCCPFDHCPNVRPAIALLKEMQFTNYKLLNLPHNIKADWIDKGYPIVKQK